jgi:hypothetical protein
MDHTQREIRNEIETTRADMVQKIATLEDRVDCTIQGVKRSFDPKYQTQQHPWLAFGISLAAGYLMSGLILGRPAPKVVLPDDWNERIPSKQQSTGIVQSIVGMLSGVVTAAAASMAREYTSGFLFKRKHNGRGNGHDPDPTTGSTYPR